MSNVIKLYLLGCLLFAIYKPRGDKEGYFMDIANSFGYYLGASIRLVYDYSFGIIF